MRNRIARALALAAVLGACGSDRGAERESERLRAAVDSMLPALARLASLPVLEEVRLERRDSAAVRAFVERQLDRELPPDVLASVHATWTLLGLIPDTLDLRALMLRLYSEQIVGYYDPDERTLYVVEGVAADGVAPVLAHELVHALQDQHADLDSLIARERGTDRQTAAHAALEGHATVTMFAWLAEQAAGGPVDPAALPDPAEQLAAGLRAQNDQFPVFRSAPLVIRESLLFPYVAGARFVHQLWQTRPDTRPAPLGEWLPQSTEQVLHPEAAFLERRSELLPLRIGGDRGAWRALGDDDGFGEFQTSVFLEQHLGADARAAARGWAGDVYRLLVTTGGERALLWYSVWDDEEAAARFAGALGSVQRARPDWRLDVTQGAVADRPALRVLLSRSGAAPVAAALPPVCLDSAGSCVELIQPPRPCSGAPGGC